MNIHGLKKGSGEPPTISFGDWHSVCEKFTNIKVKMIRTKFMQSACSFPIVTSCTKIHKKSFVIMLNK